MGSRGIGRCSHLANTRTCGGGSACGICLSQRRHNSSTDWLPAHHQKLPELCESVPDTLLWRDLPAELLEKSCARAFIPRASVLSSSSEARRPPRPPDFVAASLDVTVRLGPGLFFETQ